MSSRDDYESKVFSFDSSFDDDDVVYLRVVPNGEGLAPKWYWHDGKDFIYVEDSVIHDVMYKQKLYEDSHEN
jgi:hypothetical protein